LRPGRALRYTEPRRVVCALIVAGRGREAGPATARPAQPA